MGGAYPFGHGDGVGIVARRGGRPAEGRGEVAEGVVDRAEGEVRVQEPRKVAGPGQKLLITGGRGNEVAEVNGVFGT
jgi:hypothetical protein